MGANDTVQQRRYAEGLRILLGMRGGEHVGGLGPEFLPAIVVEDDPFEFQFLKGVIAYGALVSLGAGGAANNVKAALGNPAGSNTLIVVTSVVAGPAALPGSRNVNLKIDPAVTAFLTAASGRPIDTRTNRVHVAAVSGENTTPPAGGGIFLESVGTNIGYAFAASPILLAPGTSLVAQVQTLNVDGAISFRWTERPALPGEL